MRVGARPRVRAFIMPWSNSGGRAVALPSVSVSQSPEGRFREYLASRPEPKRFTTQQRELLEHVFARHKHFDANELIEDLKAANRPVSRATVYRTLTLLVDAGLLKRIEVGSRTVYDHDYGYPAHDHFVCEACGAMIEFAHPRLDEVLREATMPATADSIMVCWLMVTRSLREWNERDGRPVCCCRHRDDPLLRKCRRAHRLGVRHTAAGANLRPAVCL